MKQQKKLEEQQQKEQAKLQQQQQQQKDRPEQQQQPQEAAIPFIYSSFVTTATAKQFLQDSFVDDVTPASSSSSPVDTVVKPGRENTISKVAGRITAVREMGKIIFFTIKNDNDMLQITYSANEEKGVTKQHIKDLAKKAKAGDIIGVEGVPGVTKKGEPSLFASSIQVLSKYAAIQEANCPSLTGYVKPSDPDILYRYRFLDLMCDSESQKVFRTRAKVLQSLRKFLDDRNFIEVETPVFHTVPSGAAARPFRTYHESNKSDLFLRVAPELYLKQCVVGGLERVYEVGRVFRNEDTDKSHNPEFTSCEFYQAYTTYRELIPMTEQMIRSICFDALGKYTITVSIKVKEHETNLNLTKEEKELIKEAIAEEKEESTSTTTTSTDEKQQEPKQEQENNNNNNKQQKKQEPKFELREIDLSKPFRIVDIIPELESHLGLKFPTPISSLDNEEGAAFLKELLVLHQIKFPTPASPAKLFDKLIDHFITDHVVDPTFVIGHPTFMSPLAKEDAANPGVSERFELFINGMEICNSYSELNDPVEQKHRFEQQLKQRVYFNDDEAQCVDETFLKALQSGLPPTAGWGMGIDRLVMLLCGCSAIRDVILFPLLRQAADSQDAKRKRGAASFFGFDPFMTKFILNSLEAEFLKRGGNQGANLVRTVHQAVDSIVCDQTQQRPKNTLDCCFFEKAAAVAAATVAEVAGLKIGNNNNIIINENDNNNNNNSKIEQEVAAATEEEGKNTTKKDDRHQNKIVQRSANKNDKICDPSKTPNAECGLMALLLLGGLRDGHYHIQQKSEQFLLDIGFQALCDPAVASNWWWKK